MEFVSYITYEEYMSLGGMVDEDTFVILERKAQRIVDDITFYRIQYLKIIPDEVKEVLTEFINKLGQSNTVRSSKTNTIMGSNVDDIVQYSNGVETITWRKPTSEEETKEMTKYAQTCLPTWLIYRGILTDFLKLVPEEYLDLDKI